MFVLLWLVSFVWADEFNVLIKKNCLSMSCREIKLNRISRCRDARCTSIFINAEKAIAEHCQNSKLKSCGETQSRRLYQSCISENCLERKITSHFPSYRLDEGTHVPTATLKSTIKTTTKTTGQALPKASEKFFPNTNSQVSNPPGDQTSSLLASKNAYQSACQTKECEQAVDRGYSTILKTQLEDLAADQAATAPEIPAEIQKAYKEFGPYSPEVSRLVAGLVPPLDSSLQESCAGSVDEKKCQAAYKKSKDLDSVANYFGYTVVNGKSGPVLKPYPGFHFANAHRSEVDNLFLCRLNLARIEDRDPYEEPRYNFKGSLSSHYPHVVETTKTKAECDEKLADGIREFEEFLKTKGSPPANYHIAISGVGTEQYDFKSIDVPGNCYYYVFIPTSQPGTPPQSWFTDLGNARVKQTSNKENATMKVCQEEVESWLKKLDPSQWQEFVAFAGNKPFYRISSKMLTREKTYRGTTHLIRAYESRPLCRFESRSNLSFEGNRRLETQKEDLSQKGECTDFCNKWINLKATANQTLQAKGEKQLIDEISCKLDPQILQVSPYAVTRYDQATSDEMKSCEHYDLSWSSNPIIKAYATSIEECLGGINQIYKIKNKAEYIQTFFGNNSEGRQLSIKFNNLSY